MSAPEKARSAVSICCRVSVFMVATVFFVPFLILLLFLHSLQQLYAGVGQPVFLFAASWFIGDGHLNESSLKRRTQVLRSEVLPVCDADAFLQFLPEHLALACGQEPINLRGTWGVLGG